MYLSMLIAIAFLSNCFSVGLFENSRGGDVFVTKQILDEFRRQILDEVEMVISISTLFTIVLVHFLSFLTCDSKMYTNV